MDAEKDPIPAKKKNSGCTYQIGGYWIIWLVIIFIIVLAVLWLFIGGKEQNYIGMKPFMPGVKRASDVMDKDTMEILGIPDRSYSSMMGRPIPETRMDSNFIPETPAITPIMSSRIRAASAQFPASATTPIPSTRINKTQFRASSTRPSSTRPGSTRPGSTRPGSTRPGSSKRINISSHPISASPIINSPLISTRLVTERLANNLGNWESKKTKKESKGEGICRQFLQQHYRQYFSKIRPDFLINPATGRNLELDGYNSQLGIAFEYNGIQHYKYPNYFHKNEDIFRQQVQRDIYKREACDAAGVYLISIPYTVPHNQIAQYIESLLPENRVES